MTKTPQTPAQEALRNYYRAILALEDEGVITDHHGDILSSEMMAQVGDWVNYKG